MRRTSPHKQQDHPLGPPGADLEANTRSSNEVLSELRLLRTLFSQLTNKKGTKKKAAPAAEASLAAKKADAAEAARYRESPDESWNARWPEIRGTVGALFRDYFLLNTLFLRDTYHASMNLLS